MKKFLNGLVLGEKMSNFYMPTMKENPKEAEIVSHRLMLRTGMIKQESSGIYSWLPLGFRVLQKISAVIKEEQINMGGNEILMPTIQNADLWKKSGRYDDYGKEMLRIKDRSNRDILYGPTNEEMITEMLCSASNSYKNFPKIIFHVQWKFRDELRPRFGVMRGREFLMKDAYSFDLDKESAKKSYNKFFIAYLRTFTRLGFKAIPMKADTGPIGGDLSHEFIVLANTGESEVFCDKSILNKNVLNKNIDYDDDNALKNIVNDWTEKYARTDETHDEKLYDSVSVENRFKTRGIEVGHIFYFADKYSKSMGLTATTKQNDTVNIHMGSYGIGVSRLVGAFIESSHDEKGIIWKKSLTPFMFGLVNLSKGNEGVDSLADKIYNDIQMQGLDVLYDDRKLGAGKKFNDMELIGLPYIIVIGVKGLEAGKVEIKIRSTNEKKDLAIDEVLDFVKSI